MLTYDYLDSPSLHNIKKDLNTKVKEGWKLVGEVLNYPCSDVKRTTWFYCMLCKDTENKESVVDTQEGSM
jgi:hypothetical protein